MYFVERISKYMKLTQNHGRKSGFSHQGDSLDFLSFSSLPFFSIEPKGGGGLGYMGIEEGTPRTKWVSRSKESLPTPSNHDEDEEEKDRNNLAENDHP